MPLNLFQFKKVIPADIEYPGNLTRGVDEGVPVTKKELKNAQHLPGPNPSYNSFRLADGREATVNANDYSPTRKNRKIVHPEGLFIDEEDERQLFIDQLIGGINGTDLNGNPLK
jgi:hypothetical protein